MMATRAADASRLHDPTGHWEPTSYGIATYGDPVASTDGTASAGTFPDQAYRLADSTGGIEIWPGLGDARLFIEFDTVTGDAFLKDETATIASRLGGSLVTPDGLYTATTYGEETFGAIGWTLTLATTSAAQAWTAEVGQTPAVPLAGWWWVELALDAISDEVTAATGPFKGSALPPNTGTLAVYPIAWTDGLGTIRPIQDGPIHWRPRP